MLSDTLILKEARSMKSQGRQSATSNSPVFRINFDSRLIVGLDNLLTRCYEAGWIEVSPFNKFDLMIRYLQLSTLVLVANHILNCYRGESKGFTEGKKLVCKIDRDFMLF